jgi:serine/threonine protein kinase
VLKLAVQLVERLQVLSDFSIVHGDIQPGNFLMGKGNDNCTVHLIDFGLSRLSGVSDKNINIFRGAFSKDFLIDSIDNNVLSNNFTLRGTLIFSSVRVMRGEPCTAWDDLESLAYSLAYLLCNDLPWARLATNKEPEVSSFESAMNYDFDKILIKDVLQSKVDCSPDDICSSNVRSSRAAMAISLLLRHVNDRHLFEKPDLNMLIAMLQDQLAVEKAAVSSRSELEYEYDWVKEGISWSETDGHLINSFY